MSCESWTKPMKRRLVKALPISRKPPRLPRFTIARQAPSMTLTRRDCEILKCVYLFRRITREQVERLLFAPAGGPDHPPKTSRVRKRLKLLYHNQYLQRIPVQINPRMWAQLPVYRLSRKGAHVVAQE